MCVRLTYNWRTALGDPLGPVLDGLRLAIDQMPTDIYQKLQGRLSNVAVDPATAVTLCGTKRRAAYWNEQRLEAVRGGREAIAYHAIDHNYSTNTVRLRGPQACSHEL